MTSSETTAAAPPRRERFGTTADGAAVDVVTLVNARGTRLRAMTYGGIILSLETRDREGRLGDIVLGFDTLAEYGADSPYFGAIVGRYANRIAGGQFMLRGVTHRLAVNNGVNSLHGGLRGFDKVVWSAETFARDGERGVVLEYVSPDGEEGYPGTLTSRVTYTLTDADELAIDYELTTDKLTVANLTQHSYFNLKGAGEGNILDHVAEIDADFYTPVDSTLIPRGGIAPVQDTPFDFRVPTPVGARIDAPHEQLKRAGGYDHNWVLRRHPEQQLVRAALVREPSSGRTLEVRTTEPGMQFYTGNFLDGTLRGKGGRVIPHRGGFCLETQHFPNSPNELRFPTTMLKPGETRRSRTVFAFGTSE